ncbi:MAG: preprotein translocase subunit SecA [Patescibacteria group bacterium]
MSSTKTVTKNSKNTSFNTILDTLLGQRRELSRYAKTVAKVNSLEESISKLSDAELKAKTQEFKDKFKGVTDFKQEEKIIQEILPEAFAVVREAAARVLKKRHFDVQLVGGLVLHEGRIAEMRTGEGKTLVATLPAYLNALVPRRQVHIVTVNDFLARLGASEMGEVFDFLGLTIGVIQNQASFYFQLGASADDGSERRRQVGMVETGEGGIDDDSRTVLDVENLVPCSRQRAYSYEDENGELKVVDIVYGTNSEYGFDYLRDNMAQTQDEVVQKAGLNMAIVDEVDSILIDEARTPLIISAPDTDSSNLYKHFADVVARLNAETDFTVDEKRKLTTLTDLGIEKVERLLDIQNLYEKPENVVLVHHLEQALKARGNFTREKDYVVKGGEIVIVDEFTGRLMFGRRYNQGLHQAIEAKEGVPIQGESKTTATITFQNYFRLYEKLAGMTGTASTEAEEFYKIYKLETVEIPTNRPVVRKDLADRLYVSMEGKYKAIARDVKTLQEKGQPVLIGTTSIENNMILGEYLDKEGVKYQLLNAKNHEQEARIIAEAGKVGAVTLATNIAGRGIDIKLGGNPPEDEDLYKKWQEEHDRVKELGGLFVLGTERHESRRIDNQLRGRSGRQGDPGVTQFYISLEDHIIRIFGGDRLAKMRIMLQVPEDQPFENWGLTKAIEQAQKKVEGQNFDYRKHVLEYDDVMNKQRIVVYARRNKILTGNGFEWEKAISEALSNSTTKILETLPKKKRTAKLKPEDLNEISQDLKLFLDYEGFDADKLAESIKSTNFKMNKVADKLTKQLIEVLKQNWAIYTEDVQKGMARYISLRALDTMWTEHLVTIDHLKDSVRFRSFNQRDPLIEFKQDAMEIFLVMLDEINYEISKTIFKVRPELVPAQMNHPTVKIGG